MNFNSQFLTPVLSTVFLSSLLLSPIANVSAAQSILDPFPDGALCVYLNAARFNPNAFVQTTGDVNSCDAPGNQAPLCMNSGLTDAAHAHTSDMIEHNFFSHDTSPSVCGSYGGCSFSNRIEKYFSGGNLAENIIAGYNGPDKVIGGFMSSSPHCDNIKGDYSCVGHGYGTSSNSTYGSYCTQDFGQCDSCDSPIICGGHYSPSSGVLKFVVAIYTSSSYDTVNVVINGGQQTIPMTCTILGGQGSIYEVSVSDLSDNQCNSYSFELLNGSDLLDSYPESGQGLLETDGFGSCSSSVDSSASAPTPAPASKSHTAKKKNSEKVLTSSSFVPTPTPTPTPIVSTTYSFYPEITQVPVTNEDLSANMTIQELIANMTSNFSNFTNVTNTTTIGSQNSTDTCNQHPLPHVNGTYGSINNTANSNGTYGVASTGSTEKVDSKVVTATVTPLVAIGAILLSITGYVYSRGKASKDDTETDEYKQDDDKMNQIESQLQSPTSEEYLGGKTIEDIWGSERRMTPTSPHPLLHPLKRVTKESAWKLLPSLLKLNK